MWPTIGVAQRLAWWAHNPKVRGSKPRSAKFQLVVAPNGSWDAGMDGMAADRALAWLSMGKAVGQGCAQAQRQERVHVGRSHQEKIDAWRGDAPGSGTRTC